MRGSGCLAEKTTPRFCQAEAVSWWCAQFVAGHALPEVLTPYLGSLALPGNCQRDFSSGPREPPTDEAQYRACFKGEMLKGIPFIV